MTGRLRIKRGPSWLWLFLNWLYWRMCWYCPDYRFPPCFPGCHTPGGYFNTRMKKWDRWRDPTLKSFHSFKLPSFNFSRPAVSVLKLPASSFSPILGVRWNTTPALSEASWSGSNITHYDQWNGLNPPSHTHACMPTPIPKHSHTQTHLPTSSPSPCYCSVFSTVYYKQTNSLHYNNCPNSK